MDRSTNISDKSFVSKHHTDTEFIVDNIILTLCISIIVLSFIGNTLILIYILCYIKKRTAHNVGLISIAIADICISTLVIPLYLTVILYKSNTEKDQITTVSCKLSKYLFNWLKTVKIYSIIIMELDNYFAIAKPNRSTMVTGHCILFLAFVWFFGSALNVWELVLNTSALYPVENQTFIRCCISSNDFSYVHTGSRALCFIVIYIIPVSIISFFGCKMCCNYFRFQAPPSAIRLNHYLIIILAFLFFLCFLPSDILNHILYVLYYNTKHLDYKFIRVVSYIDIVAYSNCILGVIIYSIINIRFREFFIQLCKRETNMSSQMQTT